MLERGTILLRRLATYSSSCQCSTHPVSLLYSSLDGSRSVEEQLYTSFPQLPPVMDLPLYTTDPRSALSDLGSSAYQLLDKAIMLNQVMRQSGRECSQVLFHAILNRMRNGSSTEDNWREHQVCIRSTVLPPTATSQVSLGRYHPQGPGHA